MSDINDLAKAGSLPHHKTLDVVGEAMLSDDAVDAAMKVLLLDEQIARIVDLEQNYAARPRVVVLRRAVTLGLDAIDKARRQQQRARLRTDDPMPPPPPS